MECIHKIKMLQPLEPNENGKRPLIPITPKWSKMEHIYIDQNGNKAKEIEIPCGQCINCRLNYAEQWAQRIMHECEEYKCNYFITFTYDDEHVPMNKRINEYGEIEWVKTLYKDDLKKFIKKLRNYYAYKYKHDNIRYYSSGEYGDQFGRPHYHNIFFNLPIPDLKLIGVSKSGANLYQSLQLEELWGKGIVGIEDVTFDSAAYCAKYMQKKLKGKDFKYYEEACKEPEFSMMSTHPGIGRNYYEKHKEDMYKHDQVFIKRYNKARTVKPAKYYDKLFDIDNPERMKELKAMRERAALDNKLNDLHIYGNEITMRERKEEICNERIKQQKLLTLAKNQVY